MFVDITNLEELKDRYNSEKPCVMKIEIDNYDDLINAVNASPRLELSSENSCGCKCDNDSKSSDCRGFLGFSVSGRFR